MGYKKEFDEFIQKWQEFKESGKMTRGFVFRNLLAEYESSILHIMFDFFIFLEITKEKGEE